MTRYAKIVDGAVAEYPYSFAALRRDNPNVSFSRALSDERLADFGVLAIAEVAQPAHDPITQNVAEGLPELVGGVWTQAWVVADAGAGEVAARQKAEADASAKAAVKVDSFVASFVVMTPAEVTAYINANVTDLPSAKAVLGKLALMVLILARREFT